MGQWAAVEAIDGDGERPPPEFGHETPLAEQAARLCYVLGRLDFSGKKVLDCGCGAGSSLAFILSDTPSARCVGIDLDKDAIAHARIRYPSLDLRVMDGLALSFESASFDIVLSFEVLEHLNDDQQRRYISETHRVLKDGGTLALSTPNKNVFSLGHPISLNLDHVRELTLGQLIDLIGEKYGSIDVYGQYFHDSRLRGRDLAYLKAQFRPVKRLKRRIVRSVRSFAIGARLHDAYEAHKRKLGGASGLYPITITADDFSFDRQRLDVAKWFLCLCQK